MRPEVGKAFIENSKNANNMHIGPGVLIWEELYIYNKDTSAA